MLITFLLQLYRTLYVLFPCDFSILANNCIEYVFVILSNNLNATFFHHFNERLSYAEY